MSFVRLFAGDTIKACLLSVIVISATAFGRALFVDNGNGLDANTGTSSSAAWKSLSKVSNTTLQVGDTVNLICGGSWTGQSLTLKGSGTQATPIIVTSYGTGAAPQLGGVSGNCVIVTGNWIIVEKLCVSAVVHQAFSVNGQHNVVRLCEAYGSGAGAYLAGQYALVTNCHFHDLKLEVNTPTPLEDDYGAMGVWFNNSDQEVSYCRFIRCVDSSYDYGVDGGGVEVWAANQDIQNINVHHNYAYRCAGFFEMGGQGKTIRNVKVAYNVVSDCFGAPVVYFNTTGTYAIKVRNYLFANNTVVVHQCGTEVLWTCIGIDALDSAGTFIMRNNLFYVFNVDRIMFGAGTATTVISSNNLVFHGGPRWFENGFTPTPTDITGIDPKLVDPGTCSQEGDYRLQSASPAINKAVDLGYTLDFAGNAVPSGSLPDIGAYEYSQGTWMRDSKTMPAVASKPRGALAKKFDHATNRIVITSSRGGVNPQQLDMNGRLVRRR